MITFLFCQQQVSNNNFTISVEADSTVAIRDTLTIYLHASGASGEDITYYLMDDSLNIDTSVSSDFKAVWQFPDTGIHRLVVFGIDSENKRSNIETIDVMVKSFAPKVTLMGDTVASINDSMVYLATASDSDGVVDHYQWEAAGMLIKNDGSAGTMNFIWNLNDTGYQTIYVKAIDNDGLESSVDSLTVHVCLSVPGVTILSGDTIISINDTAQFSCSGTDTDGKIMLYEWTITSAMPEPVIVRSKTLSYIWQRADTGMQTVTIRVIDDDGLVSLTDSIKVAVTALPPSVEIRGVKEAFAGDPVMFSASAHDDDGTVAGYCWTIGLSAGNVTVNSNDSMNTVTWTVADTGIRTVGITVTDDDALKSATSVCTVLVRNSLTGYSDTTLSSLDTLLIACTINDTQAGAVKYYWDVNGGGWDDSSTVATYRIWYSGQKVQNVVIGVRKSTLQMILDTVTITYNRPPLPEAMSIPDGDTLWAGESAFHSTIPFTCRISDADNDPVTAFMAWGRGDHRDTAAVTDSTRLSIDTTGVYGWTLDIVDSFGNHVVKNGTTHVGLEHTVCFAGHSIAVGVGDTTFSGGFRPGVLASLRDSVGEYERIRAVGPFVSTGVGMVMRDPRDDSCFAISGSFAREMLLLMDHAYTSLTADIWVLMLGVNASFSGIEALSTVELIKRILSRNPKARVYVLTSQPFAALSPWQREFYNDSVRTAVGNLKDAGFSTFIVESGDSILYDNGEFNDTLAYDEVHPNIEGYRRMASGILKVMWERVPKVFTVRKNQ